MKISSFSGAENQQGNIQGSFNTKNSRFGRMMYGLGTAIATVGKVGSGIIPGGSIVSGFFEAFGQKGMMGEYGGMTPMEMLDLQQAMLQESRVYTLLSNVMRIRHDAAMNAIRNIK